MLDHNISHQSRLQGAVNTILEFHKEPLKALVTHCYKHKLLSLGQMADIINRDKSVISRQYLNREEL